MILGLQITGFTFALLMIYMSIVHYKKGSLSGMEIATWIVIWSLVVFAVIFPEVLRTYAQTVAVSRLFDLLVVGAFIVVIFMVSSVYIKIKEIEEKVEKMIREEAFKSKRKNK